MDTRWLNQGDFDGAAEALEIGLQSAKDIEASYEVALTLLVQQRLARLTGHEPVAEELEVRSQVIFDRLGVIAVADTNTAGVSEGRSRS